MDIVKENWVYFGISQTLHHSPSANAWYPFALRAPPLKGEEITPNEQIRFYLEIFPPPSGNPKGVTGFSQSLFRGPRTSPQN